VRSEYSKVPARGRSSAFRYKTPRIYVLLPRPGEGSEVLRRACLSVCLSVCLCDRITRKPHGRTLPTFALVACGRGSVRPWWRCDVRYFRFYG